MVILGIEISASRKYVKINISTCFPRFKILLVLVTYNFKTKRNRCLEYIYDCRQMI